MSRAKRKRKDRPRNRGKRERVDRTGPSESIADAVDKYVEEVVDEATGPKLDTDVDLEDRFG